LFDISSYSLSVRRFDQTRRVWLGFLGMRNMVRRSMGRSDGIRTIYSRAGYALTIIPYDKECNDNVTNTSIPDGRKLVKKFISSFGQTTVNKNFVEVTDFRAAVDFMNNVRTLYGSAIARQVRRLSACLMSGYRVVVNQDNTLEEHLKRLGLTVDRDGRKVHITDQKGVISFVDDYYNTGLKFCLNRLLSSGRIALSFIDERPRFSVEKLLGDSSDGALLDFFKSGAYLSKSCTKFWGGKGMDSCREVVTLPDKGSIFPVLVRREGRKTLRGLAFRGDNYYEIVADILAGVINPTEREDCKASLSKHKYKRMKSEFNNRMGRSSLDPVACLAHFVRDAGSYCTFKEQCGFAFKVGQDHLQWRGGTGERYSEALRGLGLLQQMDQ